MVDEKPWPEPPRVLEDGSRHFYFAFGDHDAFAVADLPDNESAAAFALAVSEAGGASVRTVVLLTPEEVDAAAKHSVEYRAPQWSGRHAT